MIPAKKIDDEPVKEKEYVEMNVFDCKACGRKGFEKYIGTKHEEKCLSKTAVFISKVKTNQLHQLHIIHGPNDR